MTTTAPARTGRGPHLVVTAAGAALLAVCALGARGGEVGSVERAVFRAVNGLPGWLYRPMWAFQQLGNVVVALAVVLLAALAFRRWTLAVGGVVAVVAKLSLERLVKRVVERRRPATTIGDIVSRGNVPLHGLSFVSGHAVIAAAVATLLMPVLSGRWRAVPWVFVALNGIARIYVGAHNPLDIVGGIGLGLAIGGTLNAALEPDAR